MDLVMLASIRPSVGTGEKGTAAPSMSRLGHGIRANPGIFIRGVPLCGSTLSSVSVDHHPRLLTFVLKYLAYFAKNTA